MSGDSDAVATVGRDDFFNDPFFKDWWADFDVPTAVRGTQLDRQASGRNAKIFAYKPISRLRRHSSNT